MDVTSQRLAIRQSIRTPSAAGIAGIVFAVLLMASQLLMWTSIPPDPSAPATDIVRNTKTIAIALNLLPFAGIAFLWFMGVVRDRLGEREDRFFATVFLGSGLLYVAMMFTASAMAGALMSLLAAGPERIAASNVYPLGRAQIYRIMTIYGTKMSAVFMFSSSRIFLGTRIVSRWIALLGYVAGASLLLSIGTVQWISSVFPVWVIVISVCILSQGRRSWDQNTGL